MAKTSPTQRSLKLLRDEGYLCEVVEKYNSFSRKKRDLFNIGDILAIREGEILLVQTTSGSNVSARLKKIAENPCTPFVRKSGMAIHVHGWRKLKGGWACRVEDVS